MTVRSRSGSCNMESNLVLLPAGPCMDSLEKARTQPKLAPDGLRECSVFPLWVTAGPEKRC